MGTLLVFILHSMFPRDVFVHFCAVFEVGMLVGSDAKNPQEL